MRKIVLMTALVSTVAWGNHHYNDYSEERLLAVDSDGVKVLDIDAASGTLKIQGAEDSDGIVVMAVVRVDTDNEKKARDFISKRLELSLDRDGDRVWLKSRFSSGMRLWGPSGSVDLEIQVPTGTAIVIDDGSGSIVIEGTKGDLSIDDGSGSVKLRDVGNVELDDGSGSIEVTNAAGDVRIDDGSGSMTINSVGGTLTIDDGAGGITIDGVGRDLVIEREGSGSLRYSNVQGEVIRKDE